LRGSASLPSFKKGMPIPFNKQSTKLCYNDVKKRYEIILPKGYTFQLDSKLSKDRTDNIDKCLGGIEGYVLKDPSIQIKDNALFLLQPIVIPSKDNFLDSNIVAGIDLGITVPVYISLGTKDSYVSAMSIGTKDDFLRVRMRIQGQRKNAQKNNMAQGGKGRKKKLKALDRFQEKERNFVRTYNHMLSSKIMDFCIKNKAGTIHLENLSGFGKRSNNFILRNWSYFELQTMIKYKAAKEGIVIKFIAPEYTSQTCSYCGNVDKNNRSDAHDKTFFLCTSCGKTIHADRNAAINIARSTNFVIEKVEEVKPILEEEKTKEITFSVA
jgi:putative transposase